jgi:hypothetical protein
MNKGKLVFAQVRDIIAEHNGAKSPLLPARGSVGKKAQNRKTPPTISAPQEVQHNREQRCIQPRRHGGSRLPSCCDGRRSACHVLPPRAPTASLFRPDWLS